jgi:hypothetical protein
MGADPLEDLAEQQPVGSQRNRIIPHLELRIPGQSIHPFQSKASTDSNRSHPVIPVESIQRFQREGIQFSGVVGIGGGFDGIV